LARFAPCGAALRRLLAALLLELEVAAPPAAPPVELLDGVEVLLVPQQAVVEARLALLDDEVVAEVLRELQAARQVQLRLLGDLRPLRRQRLRALHLAPSGVAGSLGGGRGSYEARRSGLLLRVARRRRPLLQADVGPPEAGRRVGRLLQDVRELRWLAARILERSRLSDIELEKRGRLGCGTSSSLGEAGRPDPLPPPPPATSPTLARSSSWGGHPDGALAAPLPVSACWASDCRGRSCWPTVRCDRSEICGAVPAIAISSRVDFACLSSTAASAAASASASSAMIAWIWVINYIFTPAIQAIEDDECSRVIVRLYQVPRPIISLSDEAVLLRPAADGKTTNLTCTRPTPYCCRSRHPLKPVIGCAIGALVLLFVLAGLVFGLVKLFKSVWLQAPHDFVDYPKNVDVAPEWQQPPKMPPGYFDVFTVTPPPDYKERPESA
uniref:WW domain-containing protein n=1 Tax=Macrostomum lignano TaxID=282301 RepID=A0A1I8FCZ8_9PLAT